MFVKAIVSSRSREIHPDPPFTWDHQVGWVVGFYFQDTFLGQTILPPAAEMMAWIVLARQALQAVPCGNWRSFTSSVSFTRALSRG